VDLKGTVDKTQRMKIFYIGSLSDDNPITRLGLDIETVAPVYPEQVSDRHATLQKITYARALRLGEHGCTLAHSKTWASVLDSGARHAIILEDDAAINAASEAWLRDLAEKLETLSEPVIVYLGLSRFSTRWTWWLKLKYAHSRVKLGTLTLLDYPQLTKSGTVAYYINREAAKLLCKSGIEWIMTDDYDVYRRLGCTVLFPEHFVFEEAQSDSQTGNHSALRHNLAVSPIMEILELFYARLYAFYRWWRK
jgi:glycosyl transferase, family 25